MNAKGAPASLPFADLAGSGFGANARRLFLATRPKFLTASILPVLLGTTIGARLAGHVDWVIFAFALLAVIFVHSGANILNDVFDDMSGADRPELGIFPYTGGSRFIQHAVMSRADMARWGVATLLIGAAFGAAIVFDKGPVALALGLIGGALGTFYTMPPIKLGYRGFGEIAVGVAFGPLPVLGAAWLQTGAWSAAAALASLPVGLWIAAVLLINEVPDVGGDAAAGKDTLVVRLGRPATLRIYQGLMGVAALGAVALVSVAQLPLWTAIVPVAASGAAALMAGPIVTAELTSPELRQRLEWTLLVHAVGTLWLTLVLWAGL